MIQIGRLKIGFAQASMIVVFIVLTVCAIVLAFRQAQPDYPMPLRDLIIINESMALLATLIYGILAHLAIALINKLKRKSDLKS